MARFTKVLPVRRDEYSFGDLVYFHLLEYGTRPEGKPEDESGRPWELSAVAELLGYDTERTIRNWMNDKNLPDSIVPIGNLLFGNETRWDRERAELHEAFRVAWARKRQKTADAKPVSEADEPSEPQPQERKSSETEAQAEARADEPSGHETSKKYLPAPLIPNPQYRFSRRSVSTFGTVLAVVVGALAILRMQSDVPPVKPKAPIVEQKKEPERKVVVAPPPAPVQTEIPKQEIQKAKQAPVQRMPEQRQPKELTETEQRDAERERILRETALANIKAHQNAVEQKNKLAKQRDDDEQRAARVQRDRFANAENVAGVGFELKENTTVTGQSIGLVQVETVADCALACLRDNCDAFAYYHDQNVDARRKTRTCYRYRAPLSFSAHPHYTSGERKKDSAGFTPDLKPEAPTQTIQLVQNTPPTKSDTTDGVVQCANGPVKVTGFTLSCDRILGGGTTLGSAQLSYTVAHVNECASKCRSIQKCVAFTFNAADTPGRHACMIFGPTPEPRQSNGWVSGVR